jgi:DeoR/GlpR family transcriptional regulator of sugar metabolism
MKNTLDVSEVAQMVSEKVQNTEFTIKDIQKAEQKIFLKTRSKKAKSFFSFFFENKSLEIILTDSEISAAWAKALKAYESKHSTQ